MKKFTGRVYSTKNPQMAIVAVTQVWKHPLYQKRIRRTKKFHAHDEIGARKGDKVIIQECRPISKTKKWKIIERIKPKTKNKK